MTFMTFVSQYIKTTTDVQHRLGNFSYNLSHTEWPLVLCYEIIYEYQEGQI